MYRAEVEVLNGDKDSDTDGASFGIREVHFDADTGFWLNGKNFKLYGVCLHEDMGAFGIAVPAEAYRERLQTLQAMGINAIRTAHSPPSPEFLQETDRLGLLVMDEMFDQWSVGKTKYDYHLDFAQWHVQDTRDAAMRDRNHPSVILWSAGNEIHDTPKAELAKAELKSIVDLLHEVDPSRPVTQALFRPNVSHDYDDGLADMLDVIGQNYRPKEILAAHAADPKRIIVGTDNTHDRDQWLAVRDNPEYSGQFIWSGTDYPRRGPALAGDLPQHRPSRPHELAARARIGARELVVLEAGRTHRPQGEARVQGSHRSRLRAAANGRRGDRLRRLDPGVAGAAHRARRGLQQL